MIIYDVPLGNQEQISQISMQIWDYNWYSLYFSNISTTENEVAVPELNLLKLVPQLRDLSRTSFYSYKGSLTTPPCYQSVNWIVLKKPIAVSRKVVRTYSFYCLFDSLLAWGGSRLSSRAFKILLLKFVWDTKNCHCQKLKRRNNQSKPLERSL